VSSVVPIVFALVDDPVSMGLIASLARPGGNITGLSIQATDLAGKRLELLREVVPGLHRLAIMANVDLPSAEMERGGAQTAARTLGLEVVPAEIRRAEDIAPAFEGLKSRADALYVVGDALVITHRIRINTLALAARLPTIYYFREYVEVGGLMSYGPNIPDLFRRAADYGRQDSSRGEARRNSGRAGDQVRTRHQSYNRQGARADNPGDVPGARRRGDRMSLVMSAFGTKRTFRDLVLMSAFGGKADISRGP
jgi:hypothetical protein